MKINGFEVLQSQEELVTLDREKNGRREVGVNCTGWWDIRMTYPPSPDVFCVFTKASRQARQSCFRERSEYRGCGGGSLTRWPKKPP